MSHSASTVAGFIDIATYDEIEKYLYGIENAVTYFVRETQKCTWFTQIPVKLTSGSGQTEFGKDFSFHVSRSGDYLLNSWLRVKLDQVELKYDAANNDQNPGAKDAVDKDGTPLTNGDFSARFTSNFMHNLVKKIEIKFNDLSAHEIKSHHLDFWRNFSITASKRNGYNKMIGNVPEVSQWATASEPGRNTLGGKYLTLPLPLFFERDSGSALPTAALPYNDMRIHFEFRDWKDLLVVDKYAEKDAYYPATDPQGQPIAGERIPNHERIVSCDERYFKTAPKLSNVELWANYAIVSSEERKRMAQAARDIVIEQVQHAPVETFELPRDGQKHYDLRFSHAVKGIFFAVRNKSIPAELSNYTAQSPPNPWQVAQGLSYTPEKNILKSASLIYENTTRLGSMGVDFYQLIQPYYHAESDGTDQPGVCMYSYALDLVNHDPMGSTNFGKLTNVTLTPVSDVDFSKTKSDMLVTVVNHNIIKIAGGALGFPVL